MMMQWATGYICTRPTGKGRQIIQQIVHDMSYRHAVGNRYDSDARNGQAMRMSACMERT